MKYVLAPLADYTNAAFRRICHGFGADLTYTEMVSAAALAHGSSCPARDRSSASCSDTIPTSWLSPRAR